MERGTHKKNSLPAANRSRPKKSAVKRRSAKEKLLDHFAKMIDKQQTLQSRDEFAASKRKFDAIIGEIRASHARTRETAE